MSPRPSVSLRPLSLAIALALFAPLASAAEHYQLESGPLATQLNRFAAQAGIFLAGDASLTSGQHSRALDGSYSIEQALAILLEGSGLEAVKNGENRYELKPLPTNNGLELSALSISGKAPGSVTEGTGSYTTWSTSSSTRLNLSPQETPQPISVLTRQRMDDQRIENVVDALDATPGIIIKDFNIGAESPTITARGAGLNNFQVDGVQSSASLSNFLQSTAIYDRIEIVRGATGMMSGLGTPSATVNLIRKRPTFDPQATVNIDAGNWQRYGTGFDVSGPANDTGSVRGRLVVDYKQEGNWTDHYKQDYSVIYGIGEIDLTDDSLLTVGFSNTERNTNSPSRSFPLFYSNGQPTNFSASDNDAPGWLYNDNNTTNIFASLEHHFSSSWIGKAEINHTEYKYESMATTLIAAGLVDQSTGSGAFIRPIHWASDVTQNSFDAYITGTYSLLGREHELISGVALSKTSSKDPSYDLDSIYNVPDIWSWSDNTPKPSFSHTGESSADEYQYGVYSSTRLNVTDTTNILFGGRITDWERLRESVNYAAGTTTEIDSKESGVFIPYAGIVQSLNDTWALYASYTKIFNPQGTRMRDINGGPLPPEEGTSYEAGIKANLNDGRLNANFSIFRTEQENLAVWLGSGLGYRAESNADTEGVELEVTGALSDNWQFSSGYAYSLTKNNDKQRILPQIPLHSVKTFTTYRFSGPLDKLTIGGGFNWESKSSYAPDIYMQDSFLVANLMARYEFNENLTASLNINNIFDKEYYLGVWDDGIYGPPRNFMTSLKYTY